MKPPAYYNEIDQQKAAWLRELIARNLIAPGEVDERSIADVRPDDLRGYRQCHFFAGIGIWSYALRLAGWEDSRECWTGSCPCPSFSAAGKGEGFDDPRHLWPVWFRLIRESGPPVVFGEQADAAIGHGWLDLVHSDLEDADYAVGAAVLGACSIGAPHRRQRLYFVADSDDRKPEQPARRRTGPREAKGAGAHGQSSGRGDADLLAKPLYAERRPEREHGQDGCDRQNGRRAEAHGIAGTCGEVRGLADSPSTRHQRAIENAEGDSRDEARLRVPGKGGGSGIESGRPGPLNNFWRDADWIFCRDRKWRPVRPGTFPLAHGAPARMVRLRGFGDGITTQTAEAFISAYMEAAA